MCIVEHADTELCERHKAAEHQPPALIRPLLRDRGCRSVPDGTSEMGMKFKPREGQQIGKTHVVSERGKKEDS